MGLMIKVSLIKATGKVIINFYCTVADTMY